MGMISDIFANKEFSSQEEATKFLNEAFTGRSMADSLAEWDTRPPSLIDEARATLEQIPENSSPEIERRYAKKALGITKDCMEAWALLAWSYQLPKKIEETLLKGIAHGHSLHSALIAEVGEDHGLWGHHEARPFMRLLDSLGQFYNQYGTPEQEIQVYEEIISLNPGDNQGVRSTLLYLYLSIDHLQDAKKLLNRYHDDVDLGIAYGHVLLELLEILSSGYDVTQIEKKLDKSILSPSAFGPAFSKAKSLMREAIKLNPYVPLLITHPTSIYIDSPPTYQIGSPEQAIIFVREHGSDWVASIIGAIFMGVYRGTARTYAKKDRQDMRDTYNDLVDYLNSIDEPPWQETIMNQS